MKKRVVTISVTIVLIVATISIYLITKSNNITQNEGKPISNVTSYVASFPALDYAPVTTSYPDFPPIKIQDLSWGNDEYFTTIQNFYSALQRKDYAEVYTLGSQGRSENQIRQTYSNTDDIQYYSIVKNSELNYDVNVTLRSGVEMFFYSVNLNLNKDSLNNVYISSSSIKSEVNKTYPDCGRDTVEFVNDTGKKCLLRDWDTGDIFKVATYSITPWPFFVKGKNINRDKDYYLAHSGEFGDNVSVFIYNNSNNRFTFVDKLSNTSPFFTDGTQLPEGCKIEKLEDLSQACLSQYSDREWYKNSQYYYQNIGKYE
ncbi:MAG: hypothetical protein ABIM99_02645 [Candidatus Dojkabacteria bacterium]